MNPVVGVGLIALIGVVVAFVAVSVVAARQLVAAPSAKELPFEMKGTDSIRLPRTPLTELQGEYGLVYDGKRGHAHIGSILEGEQSTGFVHRELRTVTGTHLPSQGKGAWVRDVYLSPASAGLAFESVDIVSAAGSSPAWVVPSRSEGITPVWALHLHGIRTTRSVVLPSVSALSDAGITSLIPSWRGDTEGPQTANGVSSLGQEEWIDVEEALAFAVSSGAESVILIGWSMGGTIARLLVEKSRFRHLVTGLVLISPVTSWRAVVKHAVVTAHLPAAVAWGVEVVLANSVLSKLAGLSVPVRLSALEGDMADTTRSIPTLVLHNPADDLVPFAAVAAYADRNSTTRTLVVFDEAPHAMEWNREPERFEKTLRVWVSDLLSHTSKRE